MPELLGRVLWFIRHSLDVSQQEVADFIGMPASTVSKLELGTITVAVHHIEVLAVAYTHFERRDAGPGAPGWEGWPGRRGVAG
ncbi:MAG: helix-turn-helix transcriptional regulator [Deltaproteobacteria bacterium]|nr:helix-turn-helix transcriptional regulator [Deltaproteobacteria bacterium]